MFIDTISIVKLIKIVKINDDNGCAFESKHIHRLYKYIKYIYVKENVYNCKDLFDFLTNF